MPGIQALISTPALLKKTGKEEEREEEQKEGGEKGGRSKGRRERDEMDGEGGGEGEGKISTPPMMGGVLACFPAGDKYSDQGNFSSQFLNLQQRW